MSNKRYYSAARGGFFSERLHGNNLPDDAVEISEDDYRTLMDDGREILPDANGLPVLVDKTFTDDELSHLVRSERNSKLDETDFWVIRAVESGEALSQNKKNYRQDLRDIPEQQGFPNDITWPTKPE